MNIADPITIALTKGRILKETLPLLAKVGIEPSEDLDESRKLIVPTTLANVHLVILRGSDVPTYVKHGAADLGIAGKDMLLEFGGECIYEPLDLGIARCRLMTAGPRLSQTAQAPRRRVRVATKFLNIARAHYAARGIHADLIKLYGSMELAPSTTCAAVATRPGATTSSPSATRSACHLPPRVAPSPATTARSPWRAPTTQASSRPMPP